MYFLNSPQYTRYDKIDIYYSTGTGQSQQKEPSDFYKTIPILSQTTEINFQINLDRLSANQDYYFHMVPYSAIGSGSGWTIGPHVITVPVETAAAACDCPILSISNGTSQVNLTHTTGSITNVYSVIDTFDTGNYSTFEYVIQIDDATDKTSSHKIFVTQTGSGIEEFSYSEYAVSSLANTSFQITGGALEAKVSDALYSPATYKIFRTFM
jgi:hypothetical protein